MNIYINGQCVPAASGQSLKEIIRSCGLDTDKLSCRPLAAQMAGEIFTLNYIPCRLDSFRDERHSARRALRASEGNVKLLYYSDRAGREVYLRTMSFIVGLAFYRLWPSGETNVSCTIGSSLYYYVNQCPQFSSDELKTEIQKLIHDDIPFYRRRRDTDQAREEYAAYGRMDKAELLKWRSQETYDDYYYQGYSDYFCGEMLPSSGYLTVWDVVPESNGFLLLFPVDEDPDSVSRRSSGPLFFEAFAQGENWSSLMECRTVPELNELVYSGRIRELVRVNEALHERRFAQIAEMICQRNARIVMLAGPSSSGKTTSANRLAVQLRASGKKPVLISLDDYYRDRDELVREAGGEQPDLEHIDALDTVLFRLHMESLMNGGTADIPAFDFTSGKRKEETHRITLEENAVLIVEGLHALNPKMLPNRSGQVFRLYVSPLLPLNLDRTNRIPTSSLRLLRRIVRDHRTRGTSVRKTMEMWSSVQAGEKRWIFPFQEQADAFFNSSTLYELVLLKRAVFPLLTEIRPEETCYEEVRAIVKILNYVREADIESEIPPTSIVREFIGGNTFYI